MVFKRVMGILKHRITFLVDFGGYNKSKTISIPRWLLLTSAALALVLASSGTYLTIDAFSNPGVAQLERENAAILARYRNLEQQTDSLIAVLSEIEYHDAQLRIHDNMEVPSEDIRMMGVGGTPTESKHVAGLREIGSNYYPEINKVSETVDELLRRTCFLDGSLAEIDGKFVQDEDMRSHIPSIVPTTGRFSGKFGMRSDPILGIKKKHCGVDITTTIGTPVIAPADGVVSYVGKMSGYGIVVKINHGYGIETVYAHLSDSYVRVGQKVRRYDLICATGNTGRTVGPHLHYEVRIGGTAVNPEGYFTNGEEVLTQYPMP